MIILYFIVVFFIIIFNILIPIIIERLKLENLIFNSEKGKSIAQVKCYNNNIITFERSIFGLKVNYFIDDTGKIMTCDQNINEAVKKKECGYDKEYNNRAHPCYIVLSELLFYKNI